MAISTAWIGRARRIGVAVVVLAISMTFALPVGRPDNVHGSHSFNDVTADAVQTVYQNGVPHTDWTGTPTDSYDANSMFPRGMYYPMPCTVSYTVNWAPYTGGWAGWDGDYKLEVRLANVAVGGDLANVYDNVHSSTQAELNRLPAGVDLEWFVVPTPSFDWFFIKGNPVWDSGSISALPCPPGDPDQQNVVQTLYNAGYNVGVAFSNVPFAAGLAHPSLYADLKQAAGLAPGSAFQVTVPATRLVPGPPFGAPEFTGEREFLDNLFYTQGYSQHPDVLGGSSATNL